MDSIKEFHQEVDGMIDNVVNLIDQVKKYQGFLGWIPGFSQVTGSLSALESGLKTFKTFLDWIPGAS